MEGGEGSFELEAALGQLNLKQARPVYPKCKRAAQAPHNPKCLRFPEA